MMICISWNHLAGPSSTPDCWVSWKPAPTLQFGRTENCLLAYPHKIASFMILSSGAICLASLSSCSNTYSSSPTASSLPWRHHELVHPWPLVSLGLRDSNRGCPSFFPAWSDLRCRPPPENWQWCRQKSFSELQSSLPAAYFRQSPNTCLLSFHLTC